MKRTLALLCALMLLLTSAASALTLSEPGTLPLVTEEATITIGLPMQPDCTDYYDNEFTHMVQEKTGVALSFDLLPSDSLSLIHICVSGRGDMPGRDHERAVLRREPAAHPPAAPARGRA